MAFPGELHTITYEERDNVAWITLNRPEVHNAFNEQMQRELQRVSAWPAAGGLSPGSHPDGCG